MTIKLTTLATLDALGVSGLDLNASAASALLCKSPITGETVASLAAHSVADTELAIARANAAYLAWRDVPAPKRGEVIRMLGNLLRAHKDTLGELVSIEAGKIRAEGLGEVQEMIDICDFAVGLSRQLYGLTIATERPGHRMMETWHPAGVCAVITAFNFPVAVWAWNAALAIICGDSVIWKPSEKTPLTALATQALFERAVTEAKQGGVAIPDYLNQVLIGRADLGEALAASPKVAIVSATGSTRMGRAVGQVVAARFGKSLLELGGNNAMTVCETADLALATRAIVFSAVGTAGQRCTSLRRLFVQRYVCDALLPKLKAAYATLPIGNPLTAGTLVGPLIDKLAFDNMQAALASARAEGATVTGGERIAGTEPDAYYVTPALVEARDHLTVMCEETFAPILYVVPFSTLDEAIALNNLSSHGLSSSIFTNDLREAERFISASGSDCGIANINIGPSGAEIGGAFGGEKETGGGRESGSDSWRAYMRRATNTINYSTDLPLAQGIKFDL